MFSGVPTLPCQIHASCVAVAGRGLLIVGRSGAGKSALALQLMAYGAELVADDRCDLTAKSTGAYARRPEALPEAIEARGIGILSASCVGPTRIAAVVDLDETSAERMPPLLTAQIGQHQVPILHFNDQPHLPAALFHFLKHGFHGSMGK